MKRGRLLMLLCISLAAAACLVAVNATPSTHAGTTPNSWLDRTIEAEKRDDLNAESFGQRADTWNQCVNVDVEYKYYPWYFTPSPLLGERQDCMTPGATGYFLASNRPRQIVPYGTKRVQLINEPLTDMSMWTGPMYHVPYTNRLIHLHNTWGGIWGTNGAHTAYLDIIDDWNDAFRVSSYVGDAGNISLERAKGPDYTLEENGTEIQGVSANGLEISANGEWLHVFLSGRSYILLNLNTHEVIPYADNYQPSYAMRADVSNDGRFVARTIETYGLKLFDTTRCESAHGKFESRNCESIELLEGENSLLKQLFPGKEISIGRLQFVGNGDALDIDLRVGNNPNYEYLTYRLKPSGSEPVKYLAMGDSFSSGEGAFDYVEATDSFVSDEEYNVCHLSRKSYPYLLQQNVQADWFHSVACSGSDSEDVVYGKGVGVYLQGESQAKIKIPDDIDNSTAYLEHEVVSYVDSIRPGYVPQKEFVVKHSPSIATISIGGNDIDFPGIVKSCVFNGVTLDQVCFSSREERESKANEIDQKISVWSKNFVDIKNSLGGSDPRLYVIGYPKLLSPDVRTKCGVNVQFDVFERAATDKLVDYLNTAIKAAADAAGVRYVDVSDAFMRNGDYRLCSGGSEFAVNGLDLRRKIDMCGSAVKPDEAVLACPNSFHPNQLGQQLLAETIRSKTGNLTQSMPQNSNSTADLVRERIAFVGDADITLQDHRITYWKDIAPALIAKGEKIQINLPRSQSDLPAKPGTTATVIVHSTPHILGQLPIASDGTISGELTLPTDIETGYHRIIVSYTDIADTHVERYASFYVAQSTNDWDGDGVPNDTDPCSTVPQSGIDQDDDGIDDACDGEYVKSARAEPNTPAQADHAVNSPAHSPRSQPRSWAEAHSFLVDSSADAEDVFTSQGSDTFQFTPQPNSEQKTTDEADEVNSTLASPARGTSYDLVAAVASVVGLVAVAGWMIFRHRRS